MVAKTVARAVASRHGGQSALTLLLGPVALSYFALHDFTGSVDSQASSAVSSASFPSARLMWQPRMHTSALEAAFATVCWHFAAFLFRGKQPASSPPKGSPGAARDAPVHSNVASMRARTGRDVMGSPSETAQAVLPGGGEESRNIFASLEAVDSLSRRVTARRSGTPVRARRGEPCRRTACSTR